MKKTIVLLLSVLLLLPALAGCGKKPDASPQTFAADGSVLFDRDGVTVTTAGLDEDPTDLNVQPIVWVDIANKNDEDVYFGVTDGIVNGFTATVVLIDFHMEDGEYSGADYTFELTLPANSTGRYALSYYRSRIPGIEMETLAELSLRFTRAKDESSWPDFTSDRVRIVTGETVPAVDIADFGTVVVDNDKLRVVLGEQDYDEWVGPEILFYAENKTDRYLGLYSGVTEADGFRTEFGMALCSLAPGARGGGYLSFDEEIRNLKGIEKLTVYFSLAESDSPDGLEGYNAAAMDPVSVTYPPQIWGNYENGGVTLEIKPKFNRLLTVETPKNDPDGILFTVSETASMEAGGYDGAGWLFSFARVSEERVHELLCEDMSGVSLLSRDADGSYYLAYTPTDVRYERATPEALQRDAAQWASLVEWADDAVRGLGERNGAFSVSYGNDSINLLLARAAWRDGVKTTLSSAEFGTLSSTPEIGARYAAAAAWEIFWEINPDEMPEEGTDAIRVDFPEYGASLDFYQTPGGYVRLTTDENVSCWQIFWEDDAAPCEEIIRGWYYALAEAAGARPHDDRLDAYYGLWYDKIAKRCEIDIQWCGAPGRAKVAIRWPDSVSVVYNWTLAAVMDDDGRLVYKDGYLEWAEYDENGEAWNPESSWEESGFFCFNEAGELVWHDDNPERGENVFVR